MVKSIYLQDGEEIFVDDEDYERVSQHVWTKIYSNNTRKIYNPTIKNAHLQNFILEGSYQINKNNDFTKSNLTTKGNKHRWRKAKYNNVSKYKGVCWSKRDKVWKATISFNGQRKHIGSFANEDDAARAYNQAVVDYWNGEGYLNVIGEDNRVSSKDYNTNKNFRKTRVGKYGYKGVQRIDKIYYSARVVYKKKRFHVSSFETKQQAALVYNKCVLYLYGDDAILNDVPMTDELKELITNWEIPEKIKQLKE